MAIKARSDRTQPSSPADDVRDFDDGLHNNADLKNSSYASTPKRKHGALKMRMQVLVAGGLLVFLVMLSCLRSKSSASCDDGPPGDLVVTGSRTYYQHVPVECKRRFYIDDGNTFRRTVIRAFRNRGWRKADTPKEAQIVYDKYARGSRFDKLLPWQRYSHFP